MDPSGSAADRAREWHRARQDAVCDVVERWEHGTVARSTRHPAYFDFNVVRVEDEPGLEPAELIAFADRALAGLRHRRLDFEVLQAGARRRPALTGAGWRSSSLVMMGRRGDPPPAPDAAVEEVPYAAAAGLRRAWHLEDEPAEGYEEYEASAREVKAARGTRTLLVRDGGEPAGFAELEMGEGGAEITQLYVRPEHRGAGRGGALIAAAMRAAGPRELWIVADDEDRPKRLYERLGFVPAWRWMEFLVAR